MVSAGRRGGRPLRLSGVGGRRTAGAEVCRYAGARLIAAFLGLGLLVLAGCRKEKAAVPDAPLKTVADFFDIRVGPKVVHMQLAVTPDEMSHGLMERKDLGPDDGMLFVYTEPQGMSYWMHNTPTPLDIGFFDDGGMLEEIYPMYPFDETPVKSRSTLLTLALEMNQGWFAKNGVKPGAQIDLKALAAAMDARGFVAEKFGLKK